MRVSADRRCVALKSLDPRFRGDDGLGEARRNHRSVVPAKAGTQGFIEVWLRSPRIALHRSRIRRDATATQRSPHSRSHAFSHMALKSLDPRFRGDDDLGEVRRNHQTVVPAKAGTQGLTEVRLRSPRIALYRSRVGCDATATQRSPHSRSHAFSHLALKSLDPRFRGDDDLGEARQNHRSVVPAKAGTQGFTEMRLRSPRIALYRHAPNARPRDPRS